MTPHAIGCMAEIYQTEESKSALTVFQIYEGTGEWFDLSKKPIERASFTFGGAEKVEKGYFVTDKCIGCKLCYSKCPQKCIDISVKPVVIHQNNCLHRFGARKILKSIPRSPEPWKVCSSRKGRL